MSNVPLTVDVTGVAPGDAVFLRPNRVLAPAERTGMLEAVRSALRRAHGRDHVVVVMPFGVDLEVKPAPRLVAGTTRFEFQCQREDLVQLRVEALHDRRTGIHLEHVWDGHIDIRELASAELICDLVVEATQTWERIHQPKAIHEVR